MKVIGNTNSGKIVELDEDELAYMHSRKKNTELIEKADQVLAAITEVLGSSSIKCTAKPKSNRPAKGSKAVVIDYLKEYGQQHGTSIRSVLVTQGYKPSSLAPLLRRLINDGEIVKVSRGIYAIPTATTPPMPPISNPALKPCGNPDCKHAVKEGVKYCGACTDYLGQLERIDRLKKIGEWNHIAGE